MTEPTPEQNADELLHDGPDPIEHNGVVYVGLKLAHPLSAEQVAVVQPLRVKDYNVGNTVRVTREWGLAMIEQGRVQVDPFDRAAVRAALFLNGRDQPLTLVEIAEARAEAAAVAAEKAAEDAERLAAVQAETAERIAAADKRRSEADALIAAGTEAPQTEDTAPKTPAKAGAKRSGS